MSAIRTERPRPLADAPRRRVGSILAGLSGPGFVKRAIYRVYTSRLRSRVLAAQAPQHIGVVLDGNRRFAVRNGYTDTSIGHRFGTERIDDLLRWCDTLEVPIVTLWTLSIDNLSRPQPELDGLLKAVEEGLPHLVDVAGGLRNPRRIKASGRIELLPAPLREAFARAEQATAANGPYLLNIAAGYGGREEIVDAVRELLAEYAAQGKSAAEAAREVNKREIERHLYLNGVPDPDLIIRTSGEQRLSGFLLWQSVYSEYYFCDALWPDFRELDFLRAIRAYQQRRRRFGQ